MNATISWAGVWPYLVTPITPEMRVAEAPLEQLISRVRNAGVHGLAPLGSSGDLVYVSQGMRTDLVQACVSLAGDLPVAPGVGGFTADEALSQAEIYAGLGARAVVFMPHNFFNLSRSEATRFVGDFMHNTPLPAVLYLNPAVCHFSLDPDALLSEAEHPSFVGIKDASGSYSLFQRAHAFAERSVALFAASAVSLPATALLGATGVMSGPACLLAPALLRQYDLCCAGQFIQAVEIERAMLPVLEAFRTKGPSIVRTLVRHAGIEVGPPIPPLTSALSEGEADYIVKLIERVNALALSQEADLGR